MSEAENENKRRIDKLQGDFEKSEIKREADKEVRRAEMETLRSNLGESLAKNEAALEDGLSRNREAIARNEAAIEKLRTIIEKQGKQQMLFIVAVVTLGIGALGVYLQYFQQ